MPINNEKLMQENLHLAEYNDNLSCDRALVPEQATKTSELELKELVRLAQEFNQAAIDELYYRFRGMIINEIKPSYIQLIFGEDAENMAWEIFYSVIQELDINKPKGITGIIKLRVHDRITNEIQKIIIPEQIDSLEQSEADGIFLPDNKNNYQEISDKLFIEQTISILSKNGQKLMKMLYLEGYSLQECSEKLGRSYKRTSFLKNKCLNRMKHKLCNL